MRILTSTLGLLTLLALLPGCTPGSKSDGAGRKSDDDARLDPPAATDSDPWTPGGAASLEPTSAQSDSLPVILFLGNSLTAGYGLTPEEAFPALIQAKLDTAGYHFHVVNAGISGETSAGGVRRIGWLLQNPVAILVLELGANDALRGQDLRATRTNLQTIIDHTRGHDPATKIIIAGMQAPPNLGTSYTGEFRQLFIDLARENDAALIPFLLEGVGGIPALNQADGIHPTAEGHRIIAENVWQVLTTVLGRPDSGR